MTYTLGMTGPVNVADFRDFLEPGQWRDDLPTGQGGTPVNLLCRELLRRGRKLVVFSCDSAVTEEIVLYGKNLRLCLGPKGIRPARNFFSTEREYLLRAIAREKPDVVHAQWTYEYAMPVQKSGLPHVITAHDTPLRCLYHNFIPYRMARTMMAYRVVSRAQRIVSVSPYVARHLSRYLFYRGTTEVIPNGMPDELFDQPLPIRTTQQPLTFMSILVGWGGYKNGQVAIEAFAKVRKHRSDVRLVMFGDGHGEGQAAEQWARERGMTEGIEFAGHRAYPEVMARLATEADVLVHPSLVEAQPMALIEAMVRGVPVIGGERSGGVPWTLDDGQAGLLVNVRSAEAVAAAMLELGDGEARRKHFAAQGRDLARKRFHIRSVADAYERVYADLIKPDDE